MSYAHCDKHDADATNGCPKCEAISMVAEAHARILDNLAGCSIACGCDDERYDLLHDALVLAYLSGKRSALTYAEWEEHVPAVIRGELA